MVFKFFISILFFLPVLTMLEYSSSSEKKEKWQSLFNGKNLQGWDTYLGPKYDENKKDFAGEPIGLNQDPNQVFKVVIEDGKPAIRISGEMFGGISTLQEFENYHLQLEFKWGKLKWKPRDKQKRDSGLLYHAVGKHGADWNFWMRSQELQIQEGDCGDYWGVGGGLFDIRAEMNKDSNYVYNEKANLLTFSQKSKFGRHCIKSPDAEKPTGEWNKIDLYCSGDTSLHIINNVLNMVLYKSRQLENDQEIPLTKGKIQIQSEGAEIFYRNIRIRAIKSLPKEFLKKK